MAPGGCCLVLDCAKAVSCAAAGARLQINLDDAHAGHGIAFHALDIVDDGRQRAFEAADDAVRHVFRRQAGIIESHGNNGDIDVGENIHRQADDGTDTANHDRHGHHDESARPF